MRACEELTNVECPDAELSFDAIWSSTLQSVSGHDLGNNLVGVASRSHSGKFTGVVDLDPSDGIDDTVWTAANGDTVTNQTTSFVPGPGNTYVQTIVITGGTGRFQDAVGNATITGNFDFATLVYDGHLVGSIS